MSIEHKIDATISAEMQRQHIPGLSLAIIDKGALVLSKGYGLANVELAVPATADTVYEIASLTKLFTATAIMLLVEEGKVNLADSIAQYCPPLPDPWAAITLRHLLSHTSGVNYWSLDWTRADLTAEEIYQDAFAYPCPLNQVNGLTTAMSTITCWVW